MKLKEIQRIRRGIFEAFPKTASPAGANIVVDNLDNSPDIRRSLTGVEWWSAPSHIVEQNCDNLPLLTPEAFHYYLPAYILLSLDRFDRDNYVLQFTVYNLSPTKTSPQDPRFDAKRVLFTPEQVLCIRNFLQLILDDESMYRFYEPGERALRKFWTEPILMEPHERF